VNVPLTVSDTCPLSFLCRFSCFLNLVVTFLLCSVPVKHHKPNLGLFRNRT
jgi:hypothetical protein